MRTLLIAIITVLHLKAISQVYITPDLCAEFVQEEMADLRLLMWNAAMDGTTPAYSNDSLASTLSPDRIIEFTTTDIQVEALSPDDSDPPIYTEVMKSVRVTLGPRGLIGNMLLYEQELTQGSISYQLKAIAPLWKPILNGIELRNLPLFWMKIEDIEKLLTEDQFKFYSALFSLRSSFGDFQPMVNTTEYFSYGNIITGRSFNSWSTTQALTGFHDSALGFHLSQVLGVSLSSLKDKAIFYGDSSQTKKYANVEKELYSTSTSLKLDPDNPTALIEYKITRPFDLWDVRSFIVYKQKGDYLLEYAPPDTDVNGYNLTKEDGVKIYTSWSDIKPKMPEINQQVLEKMFTKKQN